MLALFASFLSCPALAQSIQTLEDQIWCELDRLSEQSTSLTAELNQLRNLVPELQTQCSDLESSLLNTHQQLSSYAQILERQRLRLSAQRRLIAIGVIALLAMMAIKVAVLVLKARGVSLPYWINTLL